MLVQSGRFAAAGASAVLLPALLMPSPGSSSPAITAATAVALTPTRVAVKVHVAHRPAGTVVSVRDASGRVVGRSGTLQGGDALVPVKVPEHSSTRLAVAADGVSGARQVVAHSTKAAVHASRWIVVDKDVGIGRFAPHGLHRRGNAVLRPAALHAYERMVKGAAAHGISLWAASSYRSYRQQVRLFASYRSADGAAVASTFSAKPGHSEHQTGLALDIASQTCTVRRCFARTDAGRWVATHAAAYGFILRYPRGAHDRTGYIFEPWHLRYVGTWLSGYLATAHVKTLEQAFDLPPVAQH